MQKFCRVVAYLEYTFTAEPWKVVAHQLNGETEVDPNLKALAHFKIYD